MLSVPLGADEGLWPYNQFPRDAVKEKYMLEVTPAFLDNLRLAAVRGFPAAFCRLLFRPTACCSPINTWWQAVWARTARRSTTIARMVSTPPRRQPR